MSFLLHSLLGLKQDSLKKMNCCSDWHPLATVILFRVCKRRYNGFITNTGHSEILYVQRIIRIFISTQFEFWRSCWHVLQSIFWSYASACRSSSSSLAFNSSWPGFSHRNLEIKQQKNPCLLAFEPPKKPCLPRKWGLMCLIWRGYEPPSSNNKAFLMSFLGPFGGVSKSGTTNWTAW